MKIKWVYYMKAFPYTCDKCLRTCYELREICEWCGEKNTLKKTTKKDFKRAMREKKR